MDKAAFQKLPREMKQRYLDIAKKYGVRAADTSIMDAFGQGALQGLTFGFSEEMGGLGAALVPGGDDYDSYVNRQRANMAWDQAKHPIATTAGDIAGSVAGAAIPVAGWVSGPARTARAGATAASTIGRMALRGALAGGAEGALQGVGRGEGLGGRLRGGAVGAAVGAPVGAVAGPLFAKIGAKYGKTAGSAVNRQLRKIAAETGETPEQILQRVARGEPIAGINDTTRMVARGLYNTNPAAEKIIREGAETFDDMASKRALGGVARELSPTAAGAPEPTPAIRGLWDDFKGQRFDAYRAAQTAVDEVTDPAVEAELVSAARRFPAMARKMNELARAKGLPELFDSDGGLARRITGPEVEGAQRVLRDTATDKFSGASTGVNSALGEELQGAFKGLRGVVDDTFPDMAAAREGYRVAKEATKDAPDLARSATARSTDSGLFADTFRQMAPESQQATRDFAAAGMLNKARSRARGAAAVTRELSDPAQNPAQNLMTLMEGRDYNKLLPEFEQAKSAADLLTAIKGNSTTAKQQAAERLLTDQGVLSSGITRVADTATNQGSLMAGLTRMISNAVKGDAALKPAEQVRLAKLLMSTEPEIVKRALGGDADALLSVNTIVRKMLARVEAGNPGVAGSERAAESLLEMMNQ